MKNSTKETIDNYAHKGWEPGSFIKSFLANDLMIPADCHGR